MNREDQPQQKFTGYWIPVELSQLGLSKIEQFLLSIIDSLDAPAPDYCFASNSFLAQQMELSESRISFYITKFKRKGLIKEIRYDGRRRRITCLKENWYKRKIELESHIEKKELCVKTRSGIHFQKKNYACSHEVRVRENANHIIQGIEDVVKDNVLEPPEIPKLKPKEPEKPKIKKDNEKTMTRSKDQDKTLDAKRRWKLTQEEYEHFLYMKDQGVDSDDGTIAYWCKIYSFQRIYDVLQAAKNKGATNIGAYMNKLFKTDAIVQNSQLNANKQFAEDYKKQFGWHQLKICEKYCYFEFGRDKVEIPFNLNVEDFMNRLIDKHEVFRGENG